MRTSGLFVKWWMMYFIRPNVFDAVNADGVAEVPVREYACMRAFSWGLSSTGGYGRLLAKSL